MAQYVISNGNKKIVAKYSLVGIPTSKAVFPDGKKTADLLKIKDDKPMRSVYTRKNKSEVVRSIFFDFIMLVLTRLTDEGGMFLFPGKTGANIAVKKMDQNLMFELKRKGKLDNINIVKTRYSVPVLKYDFGPGNQRKDRIIYIPRRLVTKMYKNAEEGKLKYTYNT
jgi:hypothetical protein